MDQGCVPDRWISPAQVSSPDASCQLRHVCIHQCCELDHHVREGHHDVVAHHRERTGAKLLQMEQSDAQQHPQTALMLASAVDRRCNVAK